MMSAHNDDPNSPCHMGCCGPAPDDCWCWQCRPDDFPWDEFPTVEQAAAAWGRWYQGADQPSATEARPRQD